METLHEEIDFKDVQFILPTKIVSNKGPGKKVKKVKEKCSTGKKVRKQQRKQS